MPSTSALLWASVPILLAALVYQVGIPAPVLRAIDGILVVKIVRNLFTTTYCYKSIRTHSTSLPNAECISISGGKFSNVFLDTTSYDITKNERTGHVIPGFWDGHGHLMGYGELMDSVDLFGATSMKAVKERLVTYKADHNEAGTYEHWLRGVGWDQANFKGKWPVAVSLFSAVSSLVFRICYTCLRTN